MSSKSRILRGDCLRELRKLPANSVDSLVTDPPAGIGFMATGKDHWDSDKGGREHWIAWMRDVMAECLRVLKPGAHGLVWALPRTSHWTGTALEDAGFEVRDTVLHCFGSGFPKSLNVGKALDKMAGAERIKTLVPTKRGNRPEQAGAIALRATGMRDISAPATAAAKEWDGWGTALKPAVEIWWLVRKPISARNVAENVLAFGTGAINVDASRILSDAQRPAIDTRCLKRRGASIAHSVGKKTGRAGAASSTCSATESAAARLRSGGSTTRSDGSIKSATSDSNTGTIQTANTAIYLSTAISGNKSTEKCLRATSSTTRTKTSRTTAYRTLSLCDDPTTSACISGITRSTRKNQAKETTSAATAPSGRWPANLVLSCCGLTPCVPGCAVAELDAQSGVLHGRGNKNPSQHVASGGFLNGKTVRNDGYSCDSGGASRFFKVFKERAQRATQVACSAPFAESNPSPTGASIAPGFAQEKRPLALVGKSRSRNLPALNAASDSRITPQTRLERIHSAPGSAALSSILERNARLVSCVDRLCGKCVTTTVREAVRTKRLPKKGLPRGRAFTIALKRQILSHALVTFAERQASTDIISTIPSRKRSCGCASIVTDAITILERSAQSFASGLSESLSPANQESGLFHDGARFAYISKPSRRERNAGCEAIPERSAKERIGGMKRLNDKNQQRLGASNHHPTVKPMRLMRYLITLVTPPGGVCLDPFLGSGTTAVAARQAGFRFIGIERDPAYVKIARARIAAARAARPDVGAGIGATT